MTTTAKFACIVIILWTSALLAASLPIRFAQAAPVTSEIVINEIDNDQPGTDTDEYIEIYNGSASAINLDTYSLEWVSGQGGVSAIV